MAKISASTFQRRLLWVSIIFGLFVVFDIALFGWLILRSLSQREVDQLLLATRQEASELARHLASAAEKGDQDLYFVVAAERETRTFLDAVPLQRDIVETIEVTNKDGILVYRKSTRTTFPNTETLPTAEPSEVPRLHTEITQDRDTRFQIEEKIGDFGWLRLKVDPMELEQRVARLRGELIRQATLIGTVTLVLLGAAYTCIWLLLRRAQRLEDQARDAERMAYIGTLAAGLAHEIRNPLNSLNLNMQMLEEEIEEQCNRGPSSRRLLAITRSEIARLERLVTDFLSYARPRPLERRPVAAVDLLAQAVAVMAGELETRKVQLKVVDHSHGARVEVDAGQIRQSLLNLLHNALAATETVPGPPRLTLTAATRGSQVVLEVADNGVGLTPEVRDHVFDVFFSTRKGGTGLGLPIVQRIARAHGGEIELESELGQGTQVRLVLPAAVVPSDDSAHEVPLPAFGPAA